MTTTFEKFKALGNSILNPETIAVKKFIKNSDELKAMKELYSTFKISKKDPKEVRMYHLREKYNMNFTIKEIEKATTFDELLAATKNFAFEKKNRIEQGLTQFKFFIFSKLNIPEAKFSRFENNFRINLLEKMDKLGYTHTTPTVKPDK